MTWQDHCDLIRYHALCGDFERVKRSESKIDLLERFALEITMGMNGKLSEEQFTMLEDLFLQKLNETKQKLHS